MLERILQDYKILQYYGTFITIHDFENFKTEDYSCFPCIFSCCYCATVNDVSMVLLLDAKVIAPHRIINSHKPLSLYVV